MGKPEILTTYYGYKKSKFEKVGEFCLKPVTIAFGRKVNVKNFKELKSTSKAKRVYAGFLAILLAPMTLTGLLLRHNSTSHRSYIKKERFAAIAKFFDEEKEFEKRWKKLDLKSLTLDELRSLKKGLKESGSSCFNLVKSVYRVKKRDEVLKNFYQLRDLIFFHGTQSSTLAAMACSDQTLKPAGQLRKDKEFSFCGVNGENSFSINKNYISGTKLKNYNEAIGYGQVKNSETTESQKELERRAEVFQELLNCMQTGRALFIKSVYNVLDLSKKPSLDLFNELRTLKILYVMEPEQFEEKIISIVDKLIVKLDQVEPEDDEELKGKRTDIKDKLLLPIKEFKQTIPPYKEEDKQLIHESYPIVLGGDITGGDLEGEYVYKGSLKLGKELQFVFVNQKNIKKTESYLTKKAIRNVKVYPFKALEVISGVTVKKIS